jgi:hypothetical protein
MRYNIAREGVLTHLGTLFEPDSIKWDEGQEFIITWSANWTNPEMIMGNAKDLQRDEDGWISADVTWIKDNIEPLIGDVNKTIWLTIYANQVGAKQEGDKKIVSSCALKALYVTPDQKSPWDE